MSHPSENDALPTFENQITGGPARCCSLQRAWPFVLVAVTVASLCTAAYFAGRSSGQAAVETFPGMAELPLIDATSAVTSDKYSMATGAVSEDADGLFVLDHNSGLLQCSVIYPRVGQFMAQFTVQVGESLGTGGKGGEFVMLTGRVAFPQASNRPAASTVVYVMDTATGNYACYGIPFDRVAMNARRRQAGNLILLSAGSANPIPDRDNLR